MRKSRLLKRSAHLTLALSLLLTGCDPVTRHKALTTIFDGVPSLPPPEELCRQYAAELETKGKARPDAATQEGSTRKSSSHPPFDEKRCTDCHADDKTVSGGLKTSKTELCFTCHTGFLKEAYQHGPAAVGDCLACHLPHTSNNPSLLVEEPALICRKCHRERRIAESMHETFAARKLLCVDCHSPHEGSGRYFLR
jgi:predicted CXXCH cytochrome family protein